MIIMSKKSIRWINNLSVNSQRGYQSVIKKYEKFHGMSIDDLITEALDEQTQQVPPHLLKIIDRIEDFQRFLIKENLCRSTIRLQVGMIKRIYVKNRVVLPYLEELRANDGRKREYIQYEDILTHDEIRKALTEMNPITRARALTMAQGGLSNEECEHLTLTSFINETYQYHQKDNLIEALTWLSKTENPIIWVTMLIRQKTQKPYYAIIGAEAVNSIAEAKLYEYGLKKNKGVIPEKLLSNNKRSFHDTLVRINDRLGYGRVSEERKLRPHMLRKFHATYIKGSVLTYEEDSILSNAEIDEMQGRGKTSVQDTYIKTNPLRQKLLYAKVMNNLSFYNEYNYQIIGDDVVVNVTDLSLKNHNLELEVKELSRKLSEKEKNSQKLDALRNELGEDTFKELVLGILNTS